MTLFPSCLFRLVQAQWLSALDLLHGEDLLGEKPRHVWRLGENLENFVPKGRDACALTQNLNMFFSTWTTEQQPPQKIAMRSSFNHFLGNFSTAKIQGKRSNLMSMSFSTDAEKAPSRMISSLPGDEALQEFSSSHCVPALKVLRSFSGGGKRFEWSAEKTWHFGVVFVHLSCFCAFIVVTFLLSFQPEIWICTKYLWGPHKRWLRECERALPRKHPRVLRYSWLVFFLKF